MVKLTTYEVTRSMYRSEIVGMVQTVLGPISPDALGITLPHEHFFIDLRRRFKEPSLPQLRDIARQPVTLENLSWVLRNYDRNLDNLILSDETVAIREASMFKKAGGGTIVDVGSIGIRSDPVVLQRISRATGLNVVMATGYYTADFHPTDMDARSEDEIAAEIIGDLLDGIGHSGIRAGIIGELGCSWPLDPNERKALRAAARAQQATGAAISVHPGRHPAAPFEILEILEQAGAQVERVIMGHIERTELDPAALLQLATKGCYLEYDWFGQVMPMYPSGPVSVASDSERIDEIRHLVEEGHGAQVLASHDVCLKMRLSAYGGPGYAHVLSYVAVWMRAKGLSQDDIDQILVENPKRILTFAKPGGR